MSAEKRASRARPMSALRQRSTDGPPTNRLLAALSVHDFQSLLPHLNTVSLHSRQVLQTNGELIQFVYFPNGGLVSIATVLLDGTMLAAATVGDEGVVGGEAMLSADAISFGDAQVRVPDTDAERMSVEAFRHAIAECSPFRDLVGRYLHALIGQLMQNAACRARHTVQQRCAKWLPVIHDRMRGEEFSLSHEGLADMLGIQRPTVSKVAADFQRSGLIRYTHARVTVLDRQRLEALACECYPLVRVLFDRLRTIPDRTVAAPDCHLGDSSRQP
jgi:CRP-like cAMP-binding protein